MRQCTPSRPIRVLWQAVERQSSFGISSIGEVSLEVTVAITHCVSCEPTPTVFIVPGSIIYASRLGCSRVPAWTAVLYNFDRGFVTGWFNELPGVTEYYYNSCLINGLIPGSRVRVSPRVDFCLPTGMGEAACVLVEQRSRLRSRGGRAVWWPRRLCNCAASSRGVRVGVREFDRSRLADRPRRRTIWFILLLVWSRLLAVRSRTFSRTKFDVYNLKFSFKFLFMDGHKSDGSLYHAVRLVDRAKPDAFFSPSYSVCHQ